MQARIKVQKIIVIGKRGEYFDAELSKEEKDNPLPRMIEHILFLASYATFQHNKALKKNRKSDTPDEDELVTLLVLNEYSLYTCDKPLSIEQYKKLIASINTIAKRLPPNVHLVIATLPVLWEDQLLHNVCLHVEAPRKENGQPIIRHVDKKVPFIDKKNHKKDLTYKNEKDVDYPFYKEKYGDRYKTFFSPHHLLAKTAITEKNQYRGAIKVKTKSGQSFMLTIEICYEHSKMIGAKDTKQLISELTSRGKAVPGSACHVVTSCIVFLNNEHLIGTPVHADHISLKPDYIEELTIPKPEFGSSLTLYTYKPEVIAPLHFCNPPLAMDKYLSIVYPINVAIDTMDILLNRKYLYESETSPLQDMIDAIEKNRDISENTDAPSFSISK
jgi:hypothetical protein